MSFRNKQEEEERRKTKKEKKQKFAGPSAQGVSDLSHRCFLIKSSIFFDTWPSPGSPGLPNGRAAAALEPRCSPAAGRAERKIRPRTLQGPIFLDF